ncbi:FixH family protein [Pyruvatibacter mobilis]|uniref:FixH family protein n=1 Tax=Pyruvatibacter mobilis TaxID=1712261 RepID=UPI003BAE4EAF
MSDAETRGFRLTGWHVLAIFVLFFGVVFAVNGVMTYVALSTFSGIETPNAYQEGRDFNERLAAAEAQKALGWDVSIEETFEAAGDGAEVRVLITARDAGDAALAGFGGTVTFWRPVVQGEDVVTDLTETAPGDYEGIARLPARGHWEMRLELDTGLDTPYYLEKRVWAGGRQPS